MTNMVTPWHSNSCPKEYEIYNFVEAIMFIIIIYSVCMKYTQVYRRRLPKDLYGHALAQEPLPRGSWNLQFWWTFPWSSLLYT